MGGQGAGMIIAKLNVSKIDKTKLFKGEKGTYLDIILIESKNSQYGDDYMVVQGVSKEDRAAGVKGAILGNAKIHGPREQSAPAQQSAPAEQPPDEDVGW